MGSKEPRNLAKGDVEGFQLSGSQECQVVLVQNADSHTLSSGILTQKNWCSWSQDGPLRSPESNSTQSKSTARTTGKVDLEEEVRGGKKEAGGRALEQREKADPKLGHLFSGLSELHGSE